MDWKEELKIKLFYLDVPKKYHATWEDFISTLLSKEREETIEEVEDEINKQIEGNESAIDTILKVFRILRSQKGKK